MRGRPDEDIIEEYLHQLRAALRSMPGDRREEIVNDVAQHIAEARAEEPSSDAATISVLLDRIGTPEEIAAAFEDKGGDEQGRAPHDSYRNGELVAKDQPPSTVRGAVGLMYTGAAASILTAIVDLVTRNGLKAAIETGLNSASQISGIPKLTPSQINSSVTSNLIMAVIVSFVGVLLWVFTARANNDGQWAGRVTATGLFVLDTLILLIGPADLSVRGPASRATEVCLFVVWLIGLGAIALLWQRPSNNFFNSLRKR